MTSIDNLLLSTIDSKTVENRCKSKNTKSTVGVSFSNRLSDLSRKGSVSNKSKELKDVDDSAIPNNSDNKDDVNSFENDLLSFIGYLNINSSNVVIDKTELGDLVSDSNLIDNYSGIIEDLLTEEAIEINDFIALGNDEKLDILKSLDLNGLDGLKTKDTNYSKNSMGVSLKDALNSRDNLEIKDIEILNSIVGSNEDVKSSVGLIKGVINYDTVIVGDNDVISDTEEVDVGLNGSNLLYIANNEGMLTKDKIVAPAVIRQETLLQDVVKTLKYMETEGVQKIKLQLSPKDLGNMLIEVLKTSDTAKMVITLGKEDLYKMVQSNIKELNSQLSTLNLKVSEVSVELRADLDSAYMGGKDTTNSNRGRGSNKGNNAEKTNTVMSIDDIVHRSSVEVLKEDKVTLCV